MIDDDVTEPGEAVVSAAQVFVAGWLGTVLVAWLFVRRGLRSLDTVPRAARARLRFDCAVAAVMQAVAIFVLLHLASRAGDSGLATWLPYGLATIHGVAALVPALAWEHTTREMRRRRPELDWRDVTGPTMAAFAVLVVVSIGVAVLLAP
ncbi:MAG: hypothetical protein IPM29_08430 [Planctomycetes bacterium]|nr:hypothetical protein [Planctomycetota bacterium]